MRRLLGFLGAVLGAVSAARGQRFGFTHQMVPAENEPATAVALGDVDGDGDLDAYVGNYGYASGRQNRLYRNAGSGHLTDVTATSLPPLLDATLAVALGDVDGDGDLDAFVGNGTTQGAPGEQNRLHLNDGTGVFTDVTAANLPTLLGNTRAVALGDVDGDGDLDALAGNAGQSRLYSNGGTGVFTDVSATNLPALFTDTVAVALGDVDGDGDLDALMGNGVALAEQDRLYSNDGTGVFTDVTATNLPALLDVTRAVALGDVEGDGDLDAFVGNVSSQPDRLLLNGGTGVFTDVTATNLPALFTDTVAVALGDLEGDGDLDAWLLGWPDRLYVNGGTGVFTNVSATTLPTPPSGAGTVALGDMDGDGDLDAFLGGGQDRLYLQGGAGAFTDVTWTDLPFAGALSIALGDVDGDGDLDALLGGVPNRLYSNGGTGVYTDVSATNLPPFQIGYTRAVALGDVDGDGDLDAFVIQQQPWLQLNDGTGIFSDATATNLPGGFFAQSLTGISLGDVDGDGDLDAFMGTDGYFCDQDRLYFNGGTGIFSDVTATNLPALCDFTAAVALGDVDGDGDLDAFLGNGVGFAGQDRLYLNGGTGVFSDVTATNLPALLDFTRAVALGDVDGDGDLDAYLGGGNDVLLLNGGTGAFTDVTATNLPTASPPFASAIALGDVDEDGDLDALIAWGEVGSGTGNQDRLYLNGGTGVFSDATATDLPALLDLTLAVALGDLDGDGDLDAFVGNPGQNRLYVNLSRQLAWVATPRTGRPLALDLRGPAGGGWVVGVSLAPADIPLPPFGTLRLHPATLFVVGSGGFDPQGRATLSFLVPAIPALIGVPFYYQAVVGLPVRLTNLEITTAAAL